LTAADSQVFKRVITTLQSQAPSTGPTSVFASAKTGLDIDNSRLPISNVDAGGVVERNLLRAMMKAFEVDAKTWPKLGATSRWLES